MEGKLYSNNIIKGIRVGLIAFLICFFVVAVISGIINYGFMEEINRILNGSLSQEPKPTISSMLLIISIMLNVSVFNNGGVLENGRNMHLGLLIFIALPVIAFIIADRNSNKSKHFNLGDMIEYFVSSVTYSIILFVFSYIARGELLGLEIDFTNSMNLVMTIVILMCVQVFIGLNYNKNFISGVDKTRFILRVLLGIGCVGGGIGMLVLGYRYLGSIVITIIGTIIVLPNIAVYIMFTFMGASIEFGDQLQTLMSQFGVDMSFTVLPLPIRVIMIILFFGLVMFSVWQLKKENYIKTIAYFGLSFSTISFVFAYSTRMNLGFVKNLLDVQFGINYMFSFFMPLGIIFLAGILVGLIRYLKKELKN